MATQVKTSTPKLVSRGGGGQLAIWIVLAFAVHAVLIGATSIGYIRDLMDPAGAEKRQAEAKAAEDAKKAAAKGPAGTQPAATPAVATQTPAAAGTSTDPEKQALEDKKDTAVVKSITDQAKPEDIPKKPDDLGIGLDDTNPK
jgi:hypothetical protein